MCPQFASGGGIFDSSPKDAPGATFRESIELGTFEGGSAELNAAISGKFVIYDFTSSFISSVILNVLNDCVVYNQRS